MRGRLNAGQLPLARAPSADVLNRALFVQALDNRTYLFPDGDPQDRVAGIEAFGRDHPSCNFLGAQQLSLAVRSAARQNHGSSSLPW